MLIVINPASFLGSKMVKEADGSQGNYGSQGKDLSIGANILVRAALSDEFAGYTSRYFDNDIGNWSRPHPDTLDESKNTSLITEIDKVLRKLGIQNM